MLLVADDSPLRRLPVNLPRRQVMFTDALRLSAEMAAFSYENLIAILRVLVAEDRREGVKGVTVEAIAHAYGVVDAANRFRVILRSFPGLKQDAEFKLFMRQTEDVEQLRNVIQHLNSELRSIGEHQSSPLGTITWLGPSPSEDSPPTAWILQPGSFYHGQKTFGPAVDFEAKVPSGSILQVHLVTSGVRVDLSLTVDRIRSVITRMEPSVRDYALGKELLGSDVVIHAQFKPISDG